MPNVAVAPLFLFGLPQITGLPLWPAFHYLYPDLAYAVMVGVGIGFGWSGVYTALMVSAQLRSHSAEAAPVKGMIHA